MNQQKDRVFAAVQDLISEAGGDETSIDTYEVDEIIEIANEGLDEKMIAFINFVIKEGWARNEENNFNWVKTDDEGFVKEQITQYQLVQMFNDKYK